MSQNGHGSIIGDKIAMNILDKYLEIIVPNFGMLKNTDTSPILLDMKVI